ncbi:hypothetical protein, partial [Stenotrophomonas geniculata]|uniref:hypothetical protein n=1 Tax=Stenotrophomonas geniculata TaxID=86188 RepID=UPI002E775070
MSTLVGTDHYELVGVDLGRHQERSDRRLILIFFFFSVAGQHTETVRGRAGGWRRGVSRMDAAIELTWTYLQRPLRHPPAR